MHRIILATLILVIPALSFAQQSIEGKIFDKLSTEGLGYVQILNKNLGTGSFTDFDGTFRLETVHSGDTLSFGLAGYEAYTLILDSIPKKLELGLSPSSFELDEVIISPHIEVLKNLVAVDLSSAPINSSQDILRKVPGLFIAQHAGGGKAEQIFLRGFDIDHGTDLQISVDGIPVNMVSHAHGQGYADLHFLIPETIENLDFGKGPYNSDKGNFATAGYVDFQTLDRLAENVVKLEVGSFATKRALLMMNVLPDKKGRDAYIASEYVYSDGPFEAPQNFNRMNAFGKFKQVKGSHRLEFQASHFTSHWNASGQIPERAVESGMISRFGAIDDQEGGITSRSNASLSVKSFVGEKAFFDTQAYYSRYSFDLYSNFSFFLNDKVNGDKIRQKETRNLYGVKSQFNKYMDWQKVKGRFRSELGFRYDDIQGSELSRTQLDRIPLDTSSLATIQELNTFVFTDFELKTDEWRINSGIRIDHFQIQTKDLLRPGAQKYAGAHAQISPKLSIVYSPFSHWQLYYKVGKGFHSNGALALEASPNREFLPGAWGNDLGSIIKPFSGFYIDIALWHLFLQQEFVYVGDEGIVESRGRTQRKGLDLGLRYQLNHRLKLNVSLNMSEATFIDEEETGNHVPLAPRLSSVGGLTVNLSEKLSMNMQYRYLSDRPANETNTVIAEGYLITDMIMTYDFPRWTVGMSIENLFNEQWNEAQFETESQLRGELAPVSEIHYTPGSPFMLKMSLSYRF